MESHSSALFFVFDTVDCRFRRMPRAEQKPNRRVFGELQTTAAVETTKASPQTTSFPAVVTYAPTVVENDCKSTSNDQLHEKPPI